jgi:hypothetical protein
VLEVPTKVGFFFDLDYFLVLFSLSFGISILALVIRRYISISTKDKKEQSKLKKIFILSTPMVLIIYMGLFIISY